MTVATSKTNVVVVGGGMAGLAAATYAARGGANVTLLERAGEIGGRAASQEVKGFRFNRGIHALYSGGAASEVFADLGVTYTSGTPKATFVLDGSTLHAFPSGFGELLHTSLLDFGGKLAFIGFLTRLKRARPELLRSITVRDWLDSSIQREDVRRVMAAFARSFVYSSALNLVSADVFVDKLQRSLKYPVQYIDGGWQTLVEELSRIAEGYGVKVEPTSRVESLRFEGGATTGVILADGSTIDADAVVLAIDPGSAWRLLPELSTGAFKDKIDTLTAARVASLAVALKELPDPVHAIVQDLNEPRFMTAQSLYSRVAPDGAALIYLFKQLDPREGAKSDIDLADLEGLLDATQPGWRDLEVERSYLPNIAAVGALPMAASNGFAGRPDVTDTGLANVFLAGDWVGPEGFLVDASMASARRSADLAVDAASSRKGTLAA